MPRRQNSSLTTPDLVVLSYLSENPVHGYELNSQLEMHEVKDWAGVSRPQVYYSLNKLRNANLIRPTSDAEDPAGPERQIFEVTAQGKAALKDSLSREEWATQRPPPPFLTWLALCRHASKETVKKTLRRRKTFLLSELGREQMTLKSFAAENGQSVEVAKLMVGLTITHFEEELHWLEKVEKVLAR